MARLGMPLARPEIIIACTGLLVGAHRPGLSHVCITAVGTGMRSARSLKASPRTWAYSF